MDVNEGSRRTSYDAIPPRPGIHAKMNSVQNKQSTRTILTLEKHGHSSRPTVMVNYKRVNLRRDGKYFPSRKQPENKMKRDDINKEEKTFSSYRIHSI